MGRARHERLQRAGLILALLCPVAWVYTGWHLAVEAHHGRVASAGRVAEDHDHDHDDHAPAEDEGHHHDDHLLPDSLRPDHGAAFAIDLSPSEPGPEGWALATAPAAAPFDDVPPATDPPLESVRPRAPPAG